MRLKRAYNSENDRQSHYQQHPKGKKGSVIILSLLTLNHFSKKIGRVASRISYAIPNNKRGNKTSEKMYDDRLIRKLAYG